MRAVHGVLGAVHPTRTLGSAHCFNPADLASHIRGVDQASKAYVDFFAQSLKQEYAPLGITVQSILPQFVVSKVSKRAAFP